MEWKLYNNAIIPKKNFNKYDKIDATSLAKDLFKQYPKALMIKYTTNFDEYDSGQWWYCIKDDSFDIARLNSKKRNVINNGKKNFDVREINIIEYVDEIYEILCDANKGYSYNINISYKQIKEKTEIISKMPESIVIGAFLKSNDENNGKLCGYLWVNENEKTVELIEQKTIRMYERLQINAALIEMLCVLYNKKIEKEGYCLSDGERTIVHQSAFQEYLIKYFGFRKAYCKLNVIYSKKIYLIVKILYAFRFMLNPILRKTNNRLLQKINGMLVIESVLRWQKDEKI